MAEHGFELVFGLRVMARCGTGLWNWVWAIDWVIWLWDCRFGFGESMMMMGMALERCGHGGVIEQLP
jgi:hypothetical protein